MLPYALIDLHCDTLTALTPEDYHMLASLRDPVKKAETVTALADRVRGTNTLDLPGRHFSLSAIPEGVRWCQCCAVFIPDELRGEEAAAYYDLHQRSFHRQMEALADNVRPCRTAADIEAAWTAGKAAAILTVENGSALAGQLELELDREAEEQNGWITRLALEPSFTGQNLGVQLIGQAVSVYRPLGRSYLRLCIAKEQKEILGFFRAYGFYKIDECAQGDIWEKYIGYHR